MEEALRDLTGASVKSFYMNLQEYDDEFIWKTICDAERNNFIMTAGTDDISNGSDVFIEKIGISGSHAYSLLSGIEIYESKGKYYGSKIQGSRPIRLLLLRNPWGEKEWRGAWSDYDQKWKTNSELRQLLQNELKDDGKFFIEYQDFKKYYTDFQVCYYHDGYKYSGLRIKTEPEEVTYLSFDIDQKGLYYMSLMQ